MTKASSAELQKTGEEKLAKGDFSAFPSLLEAYNYGDGKNHALKAADSADPLVNVPTDEDVKAVITELPFKGWCHLEYWICFYGL